MATTTTTFHPPLSRRQSMSGGGGGGGAAVAVDSGEPHHHHLSSSSNHSRSRSRSRSGSSRRASTGGGGLAAMTAALGDPFPHGYGSDLEEEEDEVVHIQQQQHRRASFSGPIARRRGSNDTDTVGDAECGVHYHHHTVDTVHHHNHHPRGMGQLRSVRRTYSNGSSSRNHHHHPHNHNHHKLTAPTPTPPQRTDSHGSSSQHGGQATAGGERKAAGEQTRMLRNNNNNKGIHPDVVSRLSRRRSSASGAGAADRSGETYHGKEDDDDDDDEEEWYAGAGASGNDIYGYSTTGNSSSTPSRQPPIRRLSSASKQSRRNSNASSSSTTVQSRASLSRASSSRRRSSSSRKHNDPLAAAGLYPPQITRLQQQQQQQYPGRTATTTHTDDDESDMDDSSVSEFSDQGGGCIVATADRKSCFGYDDYDAVSDSDRSRTSLSSSKRSRRRNSCIIRNDQDTMMASVLLGTAARMSDRDMGSAAARNDNNTTTTIADEYDDDPDSLLNRAKGKLNKTTTTTTTTTPAGTTVAAKAKPFSTLQDNQEATDEEDNALLYECQQERPPQLSPSRRRTIGTDPLPTNGQIQPVPSGGGGGPTTILEAWRKSPLTISYAAPTAENLKASLKGMIAIGGVASSDPHGNRGGWGDLELNPTSGDDSSTPESSEKESEQSYGASMYVDTQVCQEIDMYQQKARRRASMENTCLNIDNYVKGANKIKGVKVPNFKPAEGCHNASDFVVRCFSVRLRANGFTVLKHNRSRWSKAKNRVIYLLPDGKSLTWRVSDDEKDKEAGHKANTRRPIIDLSTCIEIRHAWSPDPNTKNKRGTPVLRSRCKEGLAGKSFSLIFGKRTLDFTAFSNDQCKVLMEGFSALCFRLQLQGLQDKDDHSSRMPISEEDWASTVYGESTASASNTNTTNSLPIAPTPWGC